MPVRIPTRRAFLHTAGLASTAFAQTRRPNVIVLLTDDQGYGDLSCHGNPVLKTPALDKLHGESVRFTDFHAAPMCTPTRGQLLSGQDACRNGATSVTAGRAVLRRNLPTMGDAFAGSGYATGVFGKWHVGDNFPYRPMERGFQEAKYFHGWGLSSAPEFDNDYFNGRYQDKGMVKQFSGYCTDFWFDEAMKWMRGRHEKGEPFFCYLPTNTPHGPAWVADKYAAPYQKPGLPANFFGMIANLDENVARLEVFLRQTGLRENTILIYMTDNGGTAGVPVYNAGMRARKTQIYDGGHRVPCFVRWPAGGLRAAGDIRVPAQMQDMLPTLIDLCGLKKPARADFDGTSLAGLLKGGQNTLTDRMLVVQYGQLLKKWDSCVIWGKWRLIRGEELYDFYADAGEQTDLAKQNPAVVKRMRDHYESWWGRVEPGLLEFQPISLGASQVNTAYLSSSDWEEIYCDNVNAVLSAQGGPRGGPWSVLIERDGDYEISLARWPFTRSLPLNAPCPAKNLTAGELPEGKALPIAAARLAIAGQEQSAKTKPGDKAAVFRVTLKGGTKTTLHGWFQDAQGEDVCGAYYASVRRV
ncbi:MAG: arylsulfatase [Acidobacteria bacterium]|nr:arylsulfatase [Acidobacteriota bacterium]